jgi:transposase-like protein
MNNEPKSLQEAIIFFSQSENCTSYLASNRWPSGIVVCPNCGGKKVSYNVERRTWKCGSHHPKREFSIKVGTIFEDSAIGLDKWLTAAWMLANCKNGVSSYEIARDLKVTQKTAWFMLHRIRLGLRNEFVGRKLNGDVEADETFIGGKSRNMHVDKRERRITGTGGKDKTLVFGLLERGGRIRASVIADRKRKALHSEVRAHVQTGSALYTDALQSYEGLSKDYVHEVIDHAVRYVDGKVHTNGLENFWSLLKRGIGGTYVSVEPFHLFRYLDEQVFRYNNRATAKNKITDADRFRMFIQKIVGKRLTFAELTGKTATPTFA